MDTEDTSWKDYCEYLAAGLGYRKPWLSLPFWLVWGLAVMMEFIFSVLGIKTRPLLTRHAVLLFAYPQDFCNNKAIRDFGYTSMVPYDEAMKKTLDWVKTLKEFKKWLCNTTCCKVFLPGSAKCKQQWTKSKVYVWVGGCTRKVINHPLSYGD